LNINWSDKSIRKLEDIYDETSEVSSQYAQKITEKLLAKTDILESFPRIGRPELSFSEESREIRSLLEAHFRIVYEVHESSVVILTIWNLLSPDFKRKL
jgi:plasmid stabilization system protein ParE